MNKKGKFSIPASLVAYSGRFYLEGDSATEMGKYNIPVHLWGRN
jgi:hypothetical protein